MPGLRFTLKGVTSSPAAITVTEPTLDQDAVKTKIKAFVDAYNSLIDTTRGELSEKPIANPTTATDAVQGQLYGDAGLSSMLNVLRRQMSNVVSAAGVNDLGDLGIGIPASSSGVVSQDAKDGKLAIDDTKLDAALDSNWVAVKDFFTGFSKTVSDYVDTQTGGHGIIDDRLKAADSNIKLLKDQLDQANDADRREGNAPEGAVRGDGDALCRTRRRSRPGSPARSPRCRATRRKTPQAAAPRADYREAPSVHFVPRSALSAYTASHSVAYKQQSILTATPGQLVVMLYDGCLRFLHQAAYAMREGNVGESNARLRAPRRSSTSCVRRSTWRRAASSPAGSRASTSSARGT